MSAIARACRGIESAEEPPKLDALAQLVGLSRYHFHRLFKAETGLTPKAYATAARRRRVHDELKPGRTVTEAMYRAGFQSSGRFYEAAPDLLGMTPSAFRAGGAGAHLHFAIGKCSLGSILVAKSERGISAIELGSDPQALVRDFQRRFASARLVGDDRAFEQFVTRVVAFVDSSSPGRELPLDIRGTAFQQRVWQALREIPPGTTASYTEIARQIGQPKSARAVARACASNALAVVIPCHRVVRADGSLSGYRWGVERKRLLLERERSASGRDT